MNLTSRNYGLRIAGSMVTIALLILAACVVWLAIAVHQLKRKVVIQMSALDDKIAALKQEIQNDTTVIGSAVALINGFAQRLQEAIAAALAAGATEAQLLAMTELNTSLAANDQALAAAVAANTPAPTP
jgi:hypothetical protein